MHLGRAGDPEENSRLLIPGRVCSWECGVQRSEKRQKRLVVGVLRRTWGHSASNQEARATLSSQNTPVGEEETAWKNTDETNSPLQTRKAKNQHKSQWDSWDWNRQLRLGSCITRYFGASRLTVNDQSNVWKHGLFYAMKWKSLFCSPRLHLFNLQKYNKIVGLILLNIALI